jgi:hypothetical protein
MPSPARDAYVHISNHNSAARVRTGPTTALPSLFTAEVDDPGQPYLLELRVRTVQGRRPEVIELRLEIRNPKKGAGITTQGLREVHVARALEVAVTAAIEQSDGGEDPGSPHDDRRTDSPPKRVSKPLRGIPVGADFLQQVSDIYRAAVASGSRAPVVAVSEELGGSRATAGRWVLQARRAGLLRPSLGTKAGEAAVPARRRRVS